MGYVKRIADFDHTDADDLCKENQGKHKEECCKKCQMKKDGDCKAYLFKELDKIKSEIKSYFGNEKAEI